MLGCFFCCIMVDIIACLCTTVIFVDKQQALNLFFTYPLCCYTCGRLPYTLYLVNGNKLGFPGSIYINALISANY